MRNAIFEQSAGEAAWRVIKAADVLGGGGGVGAVMSFLISARYIGGFKQTEWDSERGIRRGSVWQSGTDSL